MELPQQETLFRLTSDLTDLMPRGGAGLLNKVVHGLLDTPEAHRRFAARNEHALEHVGEVRCVLVLADIHLGDAVFLQAVVTGLRDFFPEAEIHYAASAAAAPLLRGNPEISRLWPIYHGAPLPSPSDLLAVEKLSRFAHFDLVVNCCPFFVPGNPIPPDLPVLDFTSHAPHLLRNERTGIEPNHFLYQTQLFLHDALGPRFPAVRQAPIPGVTLSLDDPDREQAEEFLRSMHWSADTPVLMINADTASRFTRPPFAMLRRLVERLAALPVAMLVGEGHTDPGVGRRLIRDLASSTSGQLRVVPASMGVGTYAALTDLVDVFVSGDTGPLHWAAARKRSANGGREYRNRTAVVSLFGATPASMSGYDSVRPGFLPAWQDAPSATFISDPGCRNITCLNKLYKTCRVARCFDGMGEAAVFEFVQSQVAACAV